MIFVFIVYAYNIILYHVLTEYHSSLSSVVGLIVLQWDRSLCFSSPFGQFVYIVLFIWLKLLLGASLWWDYGNNTHVIMKHHCILDLVLFSMTRSNILR